MNIFCFFSRSSSSYSTKKTMIMDMNVLCFPNRVLVFFPYPFVGDRLFVCLYFFPFVSFFPPIFPIFSIISCIGITLKKKQGVNKMKNKSLKEFNKVFYSLSSSSYNSIWCVYRMKQTKFKGCWIFFFFFVLQQRIGNRLSNLLQCDDDDVNNRSSTTTILLSLVLFPCLFVLFKQKKFDFKLKNWFFVVVVCLVTYFFLIGIFFW